MSESINIQENGVAKTVSVDKLNTKLVETGDCNWVPEDAFKVGTLKVWRNGTFKASDFGVYGFDKVIAVSGSRGGDAAKMQGGAHIGEIHAEAPAIKEGGAAVKLYDVHRIEVMKSDETPLPMMAEPLLTVDDISITKTGTYRAYDYGKYGFDEVTVNIPYDAGGSGGGGGGGGGGSTPIPPDAIQIVTPPTKTEYVNGEDIDLTGMVVKAYKNGDIWKNDDYPDGTIPLREVTPSPSVVDVKPIPSSEYIYSNWYEDIPRHDGVAQLFVIGGHMITIQYWKNQISSNALVWVDGVFFNEIYTFDRSVWDPDTRTYGPGTPNFRYWQRRGASTYVLGIMSTYDPATSNTYGLVSFEGEIPDYGAELEVTVKWKRPIDGAELTTNFKVDVTVSNQNT